MFLYRNWLKSLEHVLFRHFYGDYRRVDINQVKILETEYGKFYFSNGLQTYPNLFEEVAEYKIDDLKPDDVVLDIGANIGAFTVMVASKVGRVVAIEPLFGRELSENIKLNELHNVVHYNCALGNSSSMKISFNNVTEEVQCINMDIIKNKLNIQPTFLKMDCEGGEWSLTPDDFDGIRVVEAEIHTFGGKDPYEFLTMLEDLGFICDYSWTPQKQMMLHARR